MYDDLKKLVIIQPKEPNKIVGRISETHPAIRVDAQGLSTLHFCNQKSLPIRQKVMVKGIRFNLCA